MGERRCDSIIASGAIGVPYSVWTTTNLTSKIWNRIRSGNVTENPFTMDKLDAAEDSQFYRVTTP